MVRKSDRNKGKADPATPVTEKRKRGRPPKNRPKSESESEAEVEAEAKEVGELSESKALAEAAAPQPESSAAGKGGTRRTRRNRNPSESESQDPLTEKPEKNSEWKEDPTFWGPEDSVPVTDAAKAEAEATTWKIQSSNGSGGEIQKLKICRQRVANDSTDSSSPAQVKDSPRRKKKSRHYDDNAESGGEISSSNEAREEARSYVPYEAPGVAAPEISALRQESAEEVDSGVMTETSNPPQETERPEAADGDAATNNSPAPGSEDNLDIPVPEEPEVIHGEPEVIQENSEDGIKVVEEVEIETSSRRGSQDDQDQDEDSNATRSRKSSVDEAIDETKSQKSSVGETEETENSEPKSRKSSVDEREEEERETSETKSRKSSVDEAEILETKSRKSSVDERETSETKSAKSALEKDSSPKASPEEEVPKTEGKPPVEAEKPLRIRTKSETSEEGKSEKRLLSKAKVTVNSEDAMDEIAKKLNERAARFKREEQAERRRESRASTDSAEQSSPREEDEKAKKLNERAARFRRESRTSTESTEPQEEDEKAKKLNERAARFKREEQAERTRESRASTESTEPQEEDEKAKKLNDRAARFKREEQAERTRESRASTDSTEPKSPREEGELTPVPEKNKHTTIIINKPKEVTSQPTRLKRNTDALPPVERKRRVLLKSKSKDKEDDPINISSQSLMLLVPEVKTITPEQVAAVSLDDEDLSRFDMDDQAEEEEPSPKPVKKKVVSLKPKEVEVRVENDTRQVTKRKIVIENKENLADAKSVGPKLPTQENHKVVRKISLVNEDVKKPRRSPSPGGKNPTEVLFITNLVRPFTVPQLRELLARTGTIAPNGFYIDKIKSKCYVKYTDVEMAVETRHALNGVRWPVNNPKTLKVEFVTPEDMAVVQEVAEDETGPKKEPTDPAIAAAGGWLSEQAALKPQRRVTTQVREWDMGKVGAGPLEEARPAVDGWRGAAAGGIKAEQPGDLKRRQPSPAEPKYEPPARKIKKRDNDAPARLLDDLFRKTKATPCIYWLPLTAAQIAVKEEMRRQHMAEHERRLAELRKTDHTRRDTRDRDREKSRDRRKK